MPAHTTTYTFGDIVYLITDPMQVERMVIAFTLRPGGIAYYELALGSDSSFHFEIEMTSQRDIKKAMGIDADANSGSK